VFFEPFAGGGIVSLTVAAEGLADRIVMVELDRDVAAVWKVILDECGAEWLADEIMRFELTHESVQAVLAETHQTIRQRAFTTLLRNRVLHGGILAPGSGLIKYGENGRGLGSRWYPDTLCRRIRAIAALRERIEIMQADGIEVMREHAHELGAVWFIDPPYTAGKNGKRAGRRLYVHNELDHEELFRVTATLAGDFLMTYDDAEEVRTMAGNQGFDFTPCAMQNTHLSKMKELLIGRNMDWAR
jgi:DNA adenine methylase